MSADTNETKPKPAEFDFSAFPSDTLFHERRTGNDRRDQATSRPSEPQDQQQPAERRAKKERRKRIDPTTFEKQYSEEEMEFMTAVQRFKERSGRPFPTYGEVLRVAVSLGYRRVVIDDDYPTGPPSATEPDHETENPLNPETFAGSLPARSEVC